MQNNTSFFVPIYLAMGVLGLSLGLTLPLLSLSMAAAGATVTLIGTSTLLQSLAAFLASLAAPAAIYAVGNKRLLAWSLLLCGITMAAYSVASDIPSFFAFRFFNGLAMGFIFVATEATLIAESPPDKRSRITGIYIMSLSAGAAAGPMIGFPLFAHAAGLPYLFGATVCLISLGAVLRFVPTIGAPERPPKGESFPIQRIIVPLSSAFLYGFILEGILSLIALYLKRVGLTAHEMGVVVTSFDLGGILLLYPLTKVADTAGKMRFITMSSVICGALFFVIPAYPVFLVLALFTFIGGGTVNAMYPVSMAIIGDELPESLYPRAVSLLSVAFYCGGILGPMVLSVAMDRLGYDYLFYTAGVITLLFTAPPVYRIVQGSK